MKRTVEQLERQCAPGQGVQVFVWHRGRVELDTAVGEVSPGVAMRPEFVYRQYCALKPVGALLLGVLAERGQVDFEDEVGTYLPDHDLLVARGVRLRHLLDHSAGLHRADLRLCGYPRAIRRGIARRIEVPPLWNVGTAQGYSEVAAWIVLEQVIEAATGAPIEDSIRPLVLDPLELPEIWFGIEPRAQRELADRLQYSWDWCHRTPLPALGECTPYWLEDADLSVGGYAPARALGRLYARLLELLSGRRRAPISAERLRAMTTSRRGRVPDATLETECAFGLGFMADVRSHAFGRHCSPHSFGHAGFVGSSFGFADPDADLAVAVLWNSQVPHRQTQVLRRARVTERIYAELGLSAAAPDHEASERRERPLRGSHG